MNTSLGQWTECSNSANVETFTFEIHVGGMSWNCVSRGAFLCCIRCYSGRGLYPVREKSFSYVTVLRNRIGADLSRRQFSLSAITSASTRIRSTESLPVDSGLETNSDVITEAVLNVVPQQGELSSLGLGGYTPVGLIQTTLEFLHDHAHLSWWLSIVAVTVALKAALFLPSVAMQINAAKLANLQPHLHEVNQRMAAYRAAGDQQGVIQESQKLLRLYNEHGCNPMKMFLMPMVQMPIFVSFFMALRGMAQLPVHSMKMGGTLWFTDLTIPDPTFALPVLACASFILNIEVLNQKLAKLNCTCWSRAVWPCT